MANVKKCCQLVSDRRQPACIIRCSCVTDAAPTVAASCSTPSPTASGCAVFTDDDATSSHAPTAGVSYAEMSPACPPPTANCTVCAEYCMMLDHYCLYRSTLPLLLLCGRRECCVLQGMLKHRFSRQSPSTIGRHGHGSLDAATEHTVHTPPHSVPSAPFARRQLSLGNRLRTAFFSVRTPAAPVQQQSVHTNLVIV
jgi:hypothetical protein